MNSAGPFCEKKPILYCIVNFLFTIFCFLLSKIISTPNNFSLNIFNYRIRDKELQTPKDDLGREGKYRRTSSPTICSTPNIRPSSAASSQQSKSQNFKSPAKTPKRDSPATIAAKGKSLHFIAVCLLSNNQSYHQFLIEKSLYFCFK